MLNWFRRAFDTVTGGVDRAVVTLIHVVISGLYAFLHIIFSGVLTAWDDLVKVAENFRKMLDAWIGDVERRFSEVYGWLNKEGRELWYYITHPDALAKLIFRDIIRVLLSDIEWTGETVLGYAIELLLRHRDTALRLAENVIDDLIKTLEGDL